MGTIDSMIKKAPSWLSWPSIFPDAPPTDPYTGEQKMSNTAGGALIGAGLGAATGLRWAAVPRAGVMPLLSAQA